MSAHFLPLRGCPFITVQATRRLAWSLLLITILATVAEAQPAAGNNPAAPAGALTAPKRARTASTVLLLWDRLTAPGAEAYQVVCDGAVLGTTRQFAYTAQHLVPDHAYHFRVRALDAGGRLLEQTAELTAATKAAGPIRDVRAYGAAGDGQALDTPAIQRAIDACPAGGTVLVPAGHYRVDHLDLKGNMTLELAAGATLRFLGKGVGHYERHPVALPGPDGPVSLDYRAQLSAFRADNLTLTGEGTIQGAGETWWPTTGLELVPKSFEVVDSRNLVVQGVTFENPPAWDVYPLYVDGVTFSNVTFNLQGVKRANDADGLDLDSCRDALIVGCAFGNEDDSIALKCGVLNANQARRQLPCEDVLVRDCRFDGHLGPQSHPLGFALGSEICGGVRHVRVQDCDFLDVASLAAIKCNRERRHGTVADVVFENCRYTNTVFPDEPWNRAPITFDQFYYGGDASPDEALGSGRDAPYFHDIHFRNITIDNPRGYAIYITGLAERPIQDVTFVNVTAKARLGLLARNIDGLTLEHVTVVPQDGPAFIWGKNVTQLRILP